MKNLITIACVVGLLLGFAGIASALPSGTYLDTIDLPNNNPETETAALASLFTPPLDLSSFNFIKIEENAGVSGQSGTYDFGVDTLIYYYGVKAGEGMAFYELATPLSIIEWSTEMLEVGNNGRQPDISHLSAWTKPGNNPPPPPPPSNVPEPSTVFLIGLGLLGLAGLRQKVSKR